MNQAAEVDGEEQGDRRREKQMMARGSGSRSKSNKQKQAAVEVVARQFSATWEKADGDWPDAYLTVGGTRIAVELTAIKRGIAGQAGLARPRLRFDKVVLRLVGGLQAALSEIVPDGAAVVLTVTAPIRLPGETAAALEAMIREGLARRPAKVEIKDWVHGNRIRARLVQGVAAQASKVIGFVHNPDCDPEVLLQLAQSFLQQIGAAAARRPPGKFRGERWLVVVDDAGLSPIETYRQVYVQLSLSTDFKRILMLLPGGRIETLAG